MPVSLPGLCASKDGDHVCLYLCLPRDELRAWHKVAAHGIE